MKARSSKGWLNLLTRLGITGTTNAVYRSRPAAWGEEFMVPWNRLSDQGKELDRVIMRGILKSFGDQGLVVISEKALLGYD
jgi:hypothetical protein